ncbi:plasmid pRiA4b ORF-3 family protein [Cystobacter fuscus]|uniref:plasmid pRiA4b ORF-3 family protein n=1 Tax=Cystobacter fuscus TaxID=43 RepID=UPI0005BE01D6|nr:plasmid pRiA4b ORF-3 family protein [Cystobacter fuscus]
MPSSRKSTPPGSIYVLHAQLEGIQPPIWRELHVQAGTSLLKLHAILQEAFGWTNSHLHQFETRSKIYGPRLPGDELGFFRPILDERKYLLSDLAPAARASFSYVYDMGDNWVHRIRVKKVQPAQARMRYPACTAGARAAPPEDCGGVPGYDNLLEALRNPGHEGREELLEWVGGSYDPEAFDLEATDKAIRAAR